MIPDKIERIEPDSTYPTFFHASYANQLIDMLNAIRRMEVQGGKVVWSDANVKLIFSGSVGNTATTGSGNTFVSSSVFCLCRWQ